MCLCTAQRFASCLIFRKRVHASSDNNSRIGFRIVRSYGMNEPSEVTRIVRRHRAKCFWATRSVWKRQRTETSAAPTVSTTQCNIKTTFSIEFAQCILRIRVTFWRIARARTIVAKRRCVFHVEQYNRIGRIGCVLSRHHPSGPT